MSRADDIQIMLIKKLARAMALVIGGKEGAKRYDEHVARLDAMTQEQRDAEVKATLKKLSEGK